MYEIFIAIKGRTGIMKNSRTNPLKSKNAQYEIDSSDKTSAFLFFKPKYRFINDAAKPVTI